MERKRPRTAANRGYHRKQARGRTRVVGLLILALSIALLWFLLDTVITLGVGQDRFYNVYVNGIPMRGYTLEQGYALFEALESNWANRVFSLSYGGSTWEFSPAMVGAALNEHGELERAWNFGHVGNIFARKAQIKQLKNEPRHFTSAISYDEGLMGAFLRSIQEKTDVEPVNAEVVLGVDRPYLEKESSSGSKLDVEKALEMLNNLMLSGANGEQRELPVEVLVPDVDTSDVAGALQLIVSYSTEVKGTSNRKHNIARALQKFDGIALPPGMEFSFNEIVGKRTKANGFKDAPEFSEGETRDAPGGGVCQASTTLYGAVLQTGMTIVRRSSHSMTVGYVAPSLDAAVTDTDSKDLVFRNDTDSTFYIYSDFTTSSATVMIYGKLPPYRYEFKSVILEDNIPGTTETVRPDNTGEYATYTDEKVLGSEGKKGRRSEGWLISYDRATGEEVARVRLSQDYYKPGVTVYYTGIQERGAASATPTPW